MAGLLLILLGVVKVFQAIHLQTVTGESVGMLYAALMALLFTAGAACLWLTRVSRRTES
jgi:hypothetical protein